MGTDSPTVRGHLEGYREWHKSTLAWGESLGSATEKHSIRQERLKPWRLEEGPQRHCQQRCPSYKADAHTPLCDGGGWQGSGDRAAHAKQIQSITGSTQDRASDLRSRGFLPF